MLRAARNHRHAVVIGGGLLGLEAANGLQRQGMDVTVVHARRRLMNQQLDKPAPLLLKTALEARGPAFPDACADGRNHGPDRVQGVRFKDGSVIPADLVVMTAGVRPNIALAQAAGLHCERAIVVDDTPANLRSARVRRGRMRAAPRATFGLVAPIWDQARVCGAHLAGAGHRRYVQQASATKLKVTGVDLYSAGDFIGGEGSEDLVLRDRAAASTSAWCCRAAAWWAPCCMATCRTALVFRPDPAAPRHRRAALPFCLARPCAARPPDSDQQDTFMTSCTPVKPLARTAASAAA
jgi:nitrite reductase (NADH) large subunit